MTTDHLEIEDTFDVDDPFVVPGLERFVPSDGRVESVVSRLRSGYLDTADHTLLRARVTLRRRDGDDDQGWHLKVPAGTARTELQRPLDDGPTNVVPEALERLVVGLTDGRPLVPVAVVATTRTRHRVLDADGGLVVEVDDDRVAATPSGGVTRHWREVEVELGSGSAALLRRIGTALQAAGARPAVVTSKLGRTLELTHAVPVAAAAAALDAYVVEQVDAIVAGDIDLRRGEDPVHATRVATRRFRSTLRVYAEFLDAARTSWLDTELQWWAGVLGEARDAQVQRTRHRASIAALPPELVLGPVRARLDEDTTAAEARAREAISVVQDGERYRALLAELLRWREQLPLTPAAHAGRRVLREAAAAASQRAEKRLRQAVRTGDDEALHRARKAAKRARYAHELLLPVGGAGAQRAAKRAVQHHKAVQTVLGDHQDAVVASVLLRRLGAAAGAAGENGFTFGVLWQREQDAADAARQAVLEL